MKRHPGITSLVVERVSLKSIAFQATLCTVSNAEDCIEHFDHDEGYAVELLYGLCGRICAISNGITG